VRSLALQRFHGAGKQPRSLATGRRIPSMAEHQQQLSDRYKFFGEVALEKRFVTAEQLYQALTHQARLRVEGRMEKQLGQILLEMGYITEEQVNEVLDILYPVTET
jgi:hypothetical protein